MIIETIKETAINILNQSLASDFYLLLTIISSFSLLAIAILVGLWYKFSKS